MEQQRRNHSEYLGLTSAMVGRTCPPPGWDRVKVSENLGAPVAPADTSLNLEELFFKSAKVEECKKKNSLSQAYAPPPL